MPPLESNYSLPLVFISVATAVLASFVALELARSVQNSRRKGLWNVWLWTSASAMGLGIWTMHFIGMFALQLPVSLRYSVGYTVLSLLLAVVASFAGFSFVYLLRKSHWVLAGGFIMGLGIAGMHYLGMMAMQMEVQMRYDLNLVALSVLIAIIVSTAALLILMKMEQGVLEERFFTKAITALVMGAAVSSMHYTGMAAVTFTLIQSTPASPAGFLIEGDAMISTLSVAAIVLILFPLFSVRYENRFSQRVKTELAALRINESRLRTLIENAPDAFFVYNEAGELIDVNKFACNQLGYTRSELLTIHVSEIEETGRNIETFWPLLDSGEARTINSVHVRRNGSRFPVEMNIVGIDVSGKRQMFALVRDTTEAEKFKAHLSQLAMTDELTQLYNRRALLLALEKELASAKRGKRPLSVMVLDIDHFKNVNDTYGHYAGDLALQHFATIASRSIRTEDTIGRMGGEEFAILLPNADEAAALCMGERLRTATESAQLVHEGVAIKFTVSAGVSVAGEFGITPAQLLEQADRALYRAKETGRNRVCVYTP